MHSIFGQFNNKYTLEFFAIFEKFSRASNRGQSAALDGGGMANYRGDRGAPQTARRPHQQAGVPWHGGNWQKERQWKPMQWRDT
jgi:hypothetical protein